ncbi:MAG: GNAT family N-acetyltransferase [Muribaculaceae bacterium]|nr:GNAT family N-acetyltransferase [Muribaculaceae bacterium]
MVTLRQISDIQTLIDWRAEVIKNVFDVDADSSLIEANRQYYLKHVHDGTHIAVVASCDDVDCGCGGICLTEELPSPDNPSGRCAYLMNIYVREAFRNRGVAHKIVLSLVEEAKKHNCGKIYLETTADGKPVYSSLGFRDMADMMKYYDTKI